MDKNLAAVFTQLPKGDFGGTYTIEGPGLPGLTSKAVAFSNVRGALLQSKLAMEVALIGAQRTGLERSVALLETLLKSVNSAIQEIETE